MTKAEKIFNDTYSECRIHIKDWGFEMNPDGKPASFNRLHTKEPVSTRTFNAVQKLIDSEKRMIAFDKEMGYDPDYTDLLEKALMMVQVTLDAHREAMKEWR